MHTDCIGHRLKISVVQLKKELDYVDIEQTASAGLCSMETNAGMPIEPGVWRNTMVGMGRAKVRLDRS
jgi:hypothetical protein